jgi:defect in organelle trafficking protein DotD
LTKMIKTIFSLTLVVLTVSACASGKAITPVVADADPVSMRIADAAEKASRALDTIANIDQTNNPTVVLQNEFDGAPEELLQPITLTWTGPLDKIARTLAVRVGYKFKSIGKKPATPITVAVDVEGEPVVAVLKSIGLQAGRRADIAVNPTKNVIEIRYAPADAR